MASVLAQILDRVNAVVTANVPGGTLVLREDVDPQSREESPWLNQAVHDVTVQRFSDDFDKHEDVIELQIGVRNDAAPTLACEAVHFAVHSFIVNDATLKTLSESRRLVETSYDRHSADQTSCVKVCRYVFTYLIPANTI